MYKQLKGLSIDPAANIEAVVGYGSYTKFREEVPVDLSQQADSPGLDAAFLFRWDFVVPEDSDLTDLELLERAVKLGRQSEFRDSRRRFHEWRRKLMAIHVSIDAARAEMDQCLTVYNDVIARSRMRSRTLTAVQVLAAAAPLADLAHLTLVWILVWLGA